MSQHSMASSSTTSSTDTATLLSRVSQFVPTLARPPSPFALRRDDTPELSARLEKLGIRPPALQFRDLEVEDIIADRRAHMTTPVGGKTGPGIGSSAHNGGLAVPTASHGYRGPSPTWSPSSQSDLIRRLSNLGISVPTPISSPSTALRQANDRAATLHPFPVKPVIMDSLSSHYAADPYATTAPRRENGFTPYTNGLHSPAARSENLNHSFGGGSTAGLPAHGLDSARGAASEAGGEERRRRRRARSEKPEGESSSRHHRHHRHRHRTPEPGRAAAEEAAMAVPTVQREHAPPQITVTQTPHSSSNNNINNSSGRNLLLGIQNPPAGHASTSSAAQQQPPPPQPAAPPQPVQPQLVSVVKATESDPHGMRRRMSIGGKARAGEFPIGDHKPPYQVTTEPHEVEGDDIKLPLLKDGDYIDSLTMLCVTPRGEILLTQLLVSNLGISPRAGVQVKFSNSNGVQKYVKHEFPVKDLIISPDKLTMTVGNNVSFQWDPVSRLGKVSIHYDKDQIHIDLVYTSDSGGGYKIGDGMVLFGAKKFQFLAYPAPRALVAGSVKLDGKVIETTNTLGFVSHAFQNMKSHHIACRWHMVKFHGYDHGITVNLNVGIAPKSCNHVPMGNYMVARNHIIELCGVDGHVKMLDYEIDHKTGYPHPKKILYYVKGKNSANQTVEMDLLVEKVHTIEITDILGQLPYLLRTIIKAFMAKPYFYVFLNHINAVLKIEGEKEQIIPGWIVHEILYLNPGPESPNAE